MIEMIIECHAVRIIMLPPRRRHESVGCACQQLETLVGCAGVAQQQDSGAFQVTVTRG